MTPPREVSSRGFWIGLAVVAVVGLATRLLFLGQIYLWIDETPIVSDTLWRTDVGGLKGLLHGMWLLAREVYAQQTDNGTWAALVFAICRTIGVPDLWWARLPSALVGAGVPVSMGLLARRVSGSSVAGLVAAGAALTSITQIHYSQQVLAYGPAVLVAGLLVWAGLAFTERLDHRSRIAEHVPHGFPLFMAASAAAMLHPSALPVLFSCLAVAAYSVTRCAATKRATVEQSVRDFATLSQTLVVVGLCIVVFVIPKVGGGFRSYLAPYYASNALALTHTVVDRAVAAIGFAVSRGYDLIVYALNPFYDDRLYRPLSFNPFLAVPAALVLFGAVLSWKSGKVGRTFTLMAATSVLVVLVGTMAGKYPFGGVRQCLPLTPFIYVFAGHGVAWLHGRWRSITIGLLALWVAMWLVFLPRFYSQRRSPFDGDALAQQAADNGVDTFVTLDSWGPESAVLAYHLRHRTGIAVKPLLDALKGPGETFEPFLLVSPTRSLDRLNELCLQGAEFTIRECRALSGLLSEGDIALSPVVEIEANRVFPSWMQEDSQSVYTPLNGLFMYKVERH